jgi:two-component system osmolarity sensor histidine kinase EnvZ
VELVTGEDGDRVYLEVLDRGPGIPEDAVERMLQPFTRLDTARSGSGTGLGLAIVDRIAGMHGGNIRLLSREGGGLRARLEVPIRDVSGQVPAVRPKPSAVSHQTKNPSAVSGQASA